MPAAFTRINKIACSDRKTRKGNEISIDQGVYHHLTITGPETERERFMAECFSKANDKINFDFDKLIPGEGADWNALNTEVVREGEAILLSFDTVWGLPVPIFDEVARRFPNLRVEGAWTEHEYRYGGNILCQNGNVEIEDRSEELRSAFEAMLSAPARA